MRPDTLSVHQNAVSSLAFYFVHYFHVVLLAGKTLQSLSLKMSESIFFVKAC